MSTQLAIIDLDGVVADSTERFRMAEQFANAHHDKKTAFKEWTAAFWQEAFSPLLVSTDKLIPEAEETLIALRQHYDLFFLTSRPESMRQATEDWLTSYEIVFERDSINTLIMKEPAFQYVKTPVWKAGMVHTLIRLCRVTLCLVVDDERTTLDEIVKYSSTNYRLVIYTSLHDAVADH